MRRVADIEKKVMWSQSRVNSHSFQGYLWGSLFSLLHVIWDSENVPLSKVQQINSNDKSHDTEEALYKKLKKQNFFTQADELTDLRNKYSVVFARFFNDGNI